jgi:hypothetical protein
MSKVERDLIVSGYDFGTRNSRKPVVVSKCSFVLKSTDYIPACEEALIQFERILRERPDNEIKYEWANVCRCHLTITFDVYWYDKEFFEKRKNAYRVGPHAFAFQRFGATADDFLIVHELRP